jgi:hypothetical protein
LVNSLILADADDELINAWDHEVLEDYDLPIFHEELGYSDALAKVV